MFPGGFSRVSIVPVRLIVRGIMVFLPRHLPRPGCEVDGPTSAWFTIPGDAEDYVSRSASRGAVGSGLLTSTTLTRCGREARPSRINPSLDQEEKVALEEKGGSEESCNALKWFRVGAEQQVSPARVSGMLQGHPISFIRWRVWSNKLGSTQG